MRNRYNHLPSYKYTDVEGVKPVLKKSAGKPLRDYKIEGNSYQKTSTGKNLFNVDKFVESVQSYGGTNTYITFIDGRRCINFINYTLYHKDFSEVVNFEEGKQYTWTMDIKHNKATDTANPDRANTMHLGWIYDDEDYAVINIASGSTRGTKACFRVDYLEFKQAKLTSAAGRNVSQIGFSYGYGAHWLIDLDSIQIEEGTTNTSYEIYTNGVSIPSPNYPQEIECVGELSKNLITYPYDKITPPEGVEIIDNGDGSLTINGSWAGTKYIKLTQFTLEKNVAYAFSMCVPEKYAWDELSLVINHYNSSGERIGNAGGTGKFTISYDDYSYSTLHIVIGKGKEIHTTIYPMLVVGDVVTEYEPYGKYKIPITVKSKNLLDYRTFTSRAQSTYPVTINNDGSVNFKGNYYIQTNASMLEKGKTYVFDCKFDCKDEIKPIWRVSYTDGTYSTTAYTGKSILIDYNKIPKAIFLYVAMSDSVYDVTYSNIQLTEGKESQSYEPYFNPIVNNIFLDKPLRKVGDYADYIDFKNQKVVRNICEYKMNGTEAMSLSASQSDVLEGLVRYDGSAISPPAISSLYNCFCTDFPYVGAYNYKGYAAWVIKHPTNSTRFAFRFITRHQTLEEFREWLTEKYNNGEPVTLIYILETPIDTPIDLPKLETSKYTNVFEVGTTLQPSNVIAQYYKKG